MQRRDGVREIVVEGIATPRAAIAGLVVACVMALAAPALAVETVDSARQFNPDLSLVGGCAEPEKLDPVEDPGCPTTPPSSAHPPSLFAKPTSVATDFYGNIYVGNFGKALSGSEGRVDIFDPSGVFITEVKVPSGTMAVQVDSKGYLYVAAKFEGTIDFYRYTPTEYEGSEGKIAYGTPVKFHDSFAPFIGIAINPANDHFFYNGGSGGIVEFSSAEDGNEEVGSIDLGTWPYGTGIAIDATRGRIYATDEDTRVRVFDLASPHELLDTIEPSAVPENEFNTFLSLAVDEGTGDLFLLDSAANRIYEFDEEGNYISTLERGFQEPEGAQIGIDNGPFSPNGGLSSEGRYLYVPSHKAGTGHSFAFNEPSVCPPRVQDLSASDPTDSEVELQGSIDPCGAETSYRIEYTTQARFDEEGFAGATTIEDGVLEADHGLEAIFAAVGGLQGGTGYRFRIVATNEAGSDEAEGSFKTFPNPPIEPEACPNRPFRIGFAASLPDCRAYELVTPPDTNGRAPVGTNHLGYFTNRQVSPDGNRIPFRVEGGTLPGLGGTGSYLGDPYLSTRGPDGWSTIPTGPSGDETVSVVPGGSSPDQGYSFWTATAEGSKVLENQWTVYLRFPDGTSKLLADGSLADQPEVRGLLISENGSHAIFVTSGGPTSPRQLEPEAAPDGTAAIYDRALDGKLRVVSLLPGGVPLEAGKGANYLGASLDGKGVAFTVGSKLYLRYDNAETYAIGEGVTFAGVAEGGNRIFYVEEGKLLRFDAESEEVTPFSTGKVTPVIVSPDGSAAYFISTSVLTSTPNPEGVKAKLNQQNLYLSREGAITFVGTVTKRDVEGISEGDSTQQVDGLGLWTDAASKDTPGRFAVVPARTSTDGAVLLFQSRAPLTSGFDPNGHSQVFRYDEEKLTCLSCNPITSSASADATLQSRQRGTFALFYTTAWLENLRADGRRAIFQSIDPLVPGDTDGLQDVYEWEDQGVGSCTLPAGCVYLISFGHSIRDEFLWAVSRSGDDIFVLSGDLLLPADADETVSIYDARVGGGFPGAVAPPDCQGESCRPQLGESPQLLAGSTPVTGSGDNFKPKRTCPKGKRKVKRGGKVRCVKKHRGHKAGTKGKGARK